MLNQVIVPANIFHLILSHAYSTENEEIIGMLIGHWETITSNNPYIGTKSVARVKYISYLTRSDKRKDRVEIAPENLHLAALQAEEFGKQIGTPMMVIGWYHSHPHITVFPSHVDIKTQLSQQLMDDRFFGIIVSCFDSNNENTEKIQITCFQSILDQETNTAIKVNVPLIIEPSTVTKEYDPTSVIQELHLKLSEHMYEEQKREYILSNNCVQYDLRKMNKSDKDDSLPDMMTQLYNTSIYGQFITSLIDNMIIPTTHILDLKSIELDKEIEELEKYKRHLLSSNSNTTALSIPNNNTKSRSIEDYLIQL
ncbi:JAB1/Mov34/MPN/PAD-1 ubiquitin protease-domain-containing protein [Cokeromyces recurvatus]|uniref:JAB1/Mov34/MPN/PAD-1 ubiquitin protease-domain-containing protein n=1 Tax=Cokeromyces recurvatus TaxID=90255 RepID=UPI0022203151|nr:JAB1/Mov34/MPN/PAD-1 ubiquitin protease-domain-containing protein [Cokeromyces recurvatus]KAI7907421.1 JAB1/Mov34/MPN/PAD-1 ubiquitin protease-domain-containing protein [Cokeromyces recurvatus]